MSVESLALVLHHSRARGTAKLVLVGIANHDGDGGAWPALDTLAAYANVDRRNVRAALRQLEQLGELVTDLQAGGTGDRAWYHRPNRYTLVVSCPPNCDRTGRHRCTVTGCGEPASSCAHSDRGMPASPVVDNRVPGDASVPRGGDASDSRGGMPASSEPSENHHSEPDWSPVVDTSPTARVTSPVNCGQGCTAGWLGDVDQPTPCPTCRPTAAGRRRVRRGTPC